MLSCQGHCCTRLENIGVSFGSLEILQNVNLHIHCGELTALVGPNGAGKTTLLRAILGEINYSGRMTFRDGKGNEKQPHVGYVPQHMEFAPDSPISVQDLLASAQTTFPLWLGVSKRLHLRIEKALEKVGVAHLIHRRLGELSGGELQRVLLAMAISPMPELLLLDEPVSGVDNKGLAQFYDTVCKLRHTHDLSIILVTHDLSAIAPHADRMILLNKKIIVDGKPEQILASPEMHTLMGRSLWGISSLEDEHRAHQEG